MNPCPSEMTFTFSKRDPAQIDDLARMAFTFFEKTWKRYPRLHFHSLTSEYAASIPFHS
jgi:hypothetical protein